MKLAKVDGKMELRVILGENMSAAMKDLRLGLRFTFQQDNEQKHPHRAG